MQILFLGPENSPLFSYLQSAEDEVTSMMEPLDEDYLQSHPADFIVSYGYRHILKKEVLAEFADKAINLHTSLLPWNRGADPNFWSFVENTPKGVTIHYLDAGVDTGDIIAQKPVTFADNETLATSYAKLQAEIQALFREHWPQIRLGQCSRLKQTGVGSSHRIRDKKPLEPLLTAGWDTPVTALKSLQSPAPDSPVFTLSASADAAGKIATTATPLTLLPPLRNKRRPERSNTLFIRADATRQSGSGHVMRALALAHGWQAEGGNVVFATHCDSDALCDRIDAAGVQRVALNASHPHRADLSQTLALIAQHDPVCTALDGYHFAPCYQQTLLETGCPLLVIDDTAHLPHYHADILLNQNAYADTLPYSCGRQTRLLNGPRYALLRPEFSGWQAWQRKTPQTARNVLVTLGGADADNVTQKAIHALSSWRGRDFRVKVVVGPANPHLAALQEAVGEAGRDMSLLIAPPDMPELMAWADMAVTAGGTTSLELAYMQVPAVTLVVADNQRRIAQSLDAAGVTQSLGWHGDVSPQKLACAVHHLAHSASVRCDMAWQGRRLVDGNGIRRVIKKMRETAGRQEARQQRCCG